MLWEEIENSLEYMEEEMAGVPFDEFAFMKKELTEQKGEQYSFQAHSELLKDYMTKVRLGKRRWKKKRVVRKDTVDFAGIGFLSGRKEQSGTRSPSI